MTSNHRALRARPPQEPATRRSVVGALAGALLLGVSSRALAVSDGAPGKFRPEELVDNGHRFFGSMSRGLAQLVEEATRRWEFSPNLQS